MPETSYHAQLQLWCLLLSLQEPVEAGTISRTQIHHTPSNLEKRRWMGKNTSLQYSTSVLQSSERKSIRQPLSSCLATVQIAHSRGTNHPEEAFHLINLIKSYSLGLSGLCKDFGDGCSQSGLPMIHMTYSANIQVWFCSAVDVIV